MKGWVSWGEQYPVYYLTTEDDEDFDADVRLGSKNRSGHMIELTDDELAALDQAWKEWSKWQVRLFAGHGPYTPNSSTT